jgi:hypothetical protein
MPNQLKAYRLVPWAWSAAWLLAGLGFSIPASLPSRSSFLSIDSLTYFALGLLGWGIAGFVTARAAMGKPGMAVRLAAWAVASLVAIPLGLYWMLSRDMPPYLLFVPLGLAGAIGGLASSARKGTWRLVSGVLLGGTFLLLATISFINSYLLMYYYDPISRVFGSGGVSAFVWGWPGALWGLVAGFMARWILGLRALQTTEFFPGLPGQARTRKSPVV